MSQYWGFLGALGIMFVVVFTFGWLIARKEKKNRK